MVNGEEKRRDAGRVTFNIATLNIQHFPRPGRLGLLNSSFCVLRSAFIL
jgi:hypothetical protein